MTGTALSRWTMTFFAAALGFLIAAESLMAVGYGFPAMPAEAPETLVLVHMITIGWLSLLMCGALFQFVPVLVAKPLRSGGLVLPAFTAQTVGLGCLLAGFLQLAGTLDTSFPLLAAAGLLLPSGFGLATWVVARTLWDGRPLALPARFVATGLACLIATAGVGALFTYVLSGFGAAAELFDVRARVLPLHAVAGFGGWLSFTAVGVSYRLLPMFLLAPDSERATGRAAWWSGSIALLLLIVAAPVAMLLDSGADAVLVVAGCLALTALVAYAADLVFFYRNRRRRKIELNMKAALAAFVMFYLAAAMLAVLLASGTLAEHAGALVYLVAFGWLTGLGLAQLYKIVPFLTWLECYGPVMGRKPTPRVQDLVAEQRSWPWFALYFLAVLGGTTALILDWSGVFRLAATAMLAATVAIVAELIVARRLSNLGAPARLADGAMRPRLFLPPAQQRQWR